MNRIYVPQHALEDMRGEGAMVSLRLEIEVEAHDIGLDVSFENASGQLHSIMEPTKCRGKFVREVTITVEGTVVLTMSNAHSRLRSKTISLVNVWCVDGSAIKRYRGEADAEA